MSTELIPFDYTGRQVRTVLINDEPWFVAADVCAVLGYSSGRDAVARHVTAVHRGVSGIPTPSGEQQMTVISEAGLYRLIMRSNAAGAEEFQEWVTADVLPRIRRTGTYAPAEPAHYIPATYAEALELAAKQTRELEAQRERVAELEPSAYAWDTLASGTGDYSVGDAAKILSRDPAITIGAQRLFADLGRRGWTYRQGADKRWRVKQAAVETGRLSEIPSSHYHPRTGELIVDPPQVRVTVKGIRDLHRLLGGVEPVRLPSEVIAA